MAEFSRTRWLLASGACIVLLSTLAATSATAVPAKEQVFDSEPTATSCAEAPLTASNADYFEIRAEHSGYCADVDILQSLPRRINQLDCGFNVPQRQFRISNVGGSNFTFDSRYSSACWDVPFASNTDGVDLVEWTCDGQTKQKCRINS